jgi:hypothetical protein
VFHEHIGEAAGEQVGQQLVELVRVSPLALPLGDHDPAHARVAGTRDPQPRGHGSQQPPRLGVGKPDRVQDAQGEHELAVDGRVEGHLPTIQEKHSCVWNTSSKACADMEAWGCRRSP